MNPEQVREAIELIRRFDPEKADRLEKALADNPQRVGWYLREKFPMIERFLAMRRYDPEGFELRVKDLALTQQCFKAAERVRKAIREGDDELAALELANLQALVSEHFDVRQELREYELAKLRQRIEEMEQQLIQRSNQRDSLIDQRVEELVGEQNPIPW